MMSQTATNKFRNAADIEVFQIYIHDTTKSETAQILFTNVADNAKFCSAMSLTELNLIYEIFVFELFMKQLRTGP